MDDPNKKMLDDVFKTIAARYKHYTCWFIDFDNQNQAISFWNGLTFVSPPTEGEVAGSAICDLFLRFIKYANAATLLIAGPVSLGQACEILEKARSQHRRIECFAPGQEAQAHLFESAWEKVKRERPELFIESGKPRPTGVLNRMMRAFRSVSEEEEVELQAAPLTGELRDLIWLGDDALAALMKLLQEGTSPDELAIQDADGTTTRRVQCRRETIEWVRELNRVGARAVEARDRRDAADALRFYRECLKLAPGCDLLLMSIGVCYAAAGQPKKGLRYLRRAAEMSPSNAQIRRNLEDVKRLLKR